MNRSRVILALTFFAAATLWTAWWFFGRGPEQQILSAQKNLTAAVAKRNWKKLSTLLAPDFTSSAGHDNDSAIADLDQVLRHFLTLTIEGEPTVMEASSRQGTVQTTVRLQGTGSALAQMVATRANTMQSPWEFRWRKQGPWPWNWQLFHVHHPDLQGRLPE